MIKNTFNIIVRKNDYDIANPKVIVTQGDLQVNEFNIRVMDGSADIDYTQVSSGTITFSKADGNVVQGNLAKATHGYSYTLGTNEIAYAGTVVVSIQLFGTAGERLTTARFDFEVVKDLITPQTVKSTSEFPILQELKSQLESIDVVALDNKINLLSGTGGTVEKANKSDLDSHKADTTKHLTDTIQYFTGLKSGFINNQQVAISDGGGSGLFPFSNSLILLYAIDKGDPNSYILAMGWKGIQGVSTHVLTVIKNNALTLGANNNQGTQVINGGTAANIISYGVSIHG